jgi:hypothetical protein
VLLLGAGLRVVLGKQPQHRLLVQVGIPTLFGEGPDPAGAVVEQSHALQVAPSPSKSVLDLVLWPVAVGYGLLFLGEALQLHDLLNDLVDAARAAKSTERLDRRPQQIGVGGTEGMSAIRGVDEASALLVLVARRILLACQERPTTPRPSPPCPAAASA